MKRTISLLLCVLTLLSATILALPAAAEEITPYFNNTMTTTTSFGIDSNGYATVSADYQGYSGITTGATISIKLQKKTLGLFWTTVDVGNDDNVWVFNVEGEYHTVSYSKTLSSKGTYRAVVDYAIYGSGGAADEFTDTREAVWN